MQTKPVKFLFATLLAIMVAASSTAQTLNLPDLGNSAGTVMTPTAERELGKAFMRHIRNTRDIIDDPLLTDYIQQLGQRLVANSEYAGEPFHFFLIENPQINAFAGPGGHIGIYSGLVRTTRTEAELASVLGHEIAHVTQKHLLRTWEAASNMSVPQAAILLAAIILGAAAGGDAGVAAAAGGQAALLQQQINFTRTNEKEADRVGIQLLADAGFEPRAMPSFFARMGKANNVYATKLPEYLQTHPVTNSRIADSLGRAEQFPHTQNPDDLRYQLARMRLTTDERQFPEERLRELDRLLEDGRYRSRSAVEYGRALTLLELKKPTQALEVLTALQALHPDNIDIDITLAEAEAANGDRSRAMQRLQAGLQRLPANYAYNIVYAELALRSGDAALALRSLQEFADYHVGDPRLYRLMSHAADQAGNRLLANEYLAESHYLRDDLAAAILQLEIALKQPAIDFYESSRLESRLQEIREEEAEQEKSGK